MKISALYGKRLSCTDGKRQGVILGLTLSGGAIDRLICCDENQKKFTVDGENILCLGGETRFVKAAELKGKCESLRLGKAVYTTDGKFCGYLEDCNMRGMKITTAVVAGKKVPFSDLTIGDVCILKSERDKAECAAKDMFIRAVCETDCGGNTAD